MKMEKNFFDELKTLVFKDITFGLYNKIDDDLVPQILSKKNDEHYGIDDFEYGSFDLTDKEKFLLKMHNKQFLKNITNLKTKLTDKDCIVNVDFDKQEIDVIKLKTETLF